MSANLTDFDVYVIDDNYFNGNFIKEVILGNQMKDLTVNIIEPERLEALYKKCLTDVNDLFLFSTEMKGFDHCFELATQLRAHCKKCQIAFYGHHTSTIRFEKFNLISPLGIIDFSEDNLKDQVKHLLSEADAVKRSFMKEKQILRIKSKKDWVQVDAQNINYISTIKEERNRIVIHHKKGSDYVHMSLKSIKEMNLPSSFVVLKSYIFNTRQVARIDRTNNVIYFFNGEELEVGKKIRKEVGSYI